MATAQPRGLVLMLTARFGRPLSMNPSIVHRAEYLILALKPERLLNHAQTRFLSSNLYPAQD